jgi:hypothetical protein
MAATASGPTVSGSAACRLARRGGEGTLISIAVASVVVDDQDKALAFSTNVLGFEKRQDVPPGARAG